VHKEFVQERCTVNAEYHNVVSDRLISRIRPVRPALYRTRYFFPPARQRPDAFGSQNSTEGEVAVERFDTIAEIQ